MMELRIKITRENAEKVAQIMKELAQIETGEIAVEDTKLEAIIPEKRPQLNYLGQPPELTDLDSGKPYLETPAARHVGTWGQFNSFFPVKAVLRILCRMVSENGGKAVNLQELVDRSIDTFKVARLGGYRGFPSSNKESAVGRLVWHFITSAHEMGLIKIEGAEKIPARGWGKVRISPTKEGLEFAKINNIIFDAGDTKQVLTDPEREWMLSYLKKIDAQGYKEYSFIKEIFDEIKEGNTDIASWLGNNQRFINYVKIWSRKVRDEKELKKQVANVAAMFAQSKIALLRELGVISNKRNDYTVTGKFG